MGKLPFKTRLMIAAAVFALAFFGMLAATWFLVFALRVTRYEELAILLLLLTWLGLAYFPTRQTYLALTYRISAEGLQCEGCAYDLTGNESGVCPECGRAIEPRELLRQLKRRAVCSPEASSTRRHRRFAWLLGVVSCVVVILGSATLLTWRDYWFPYAQADGFVRARNPFYFVQWNPEDPMAEVEPNSVFAIHDNRNLARFTFTSGRRVVLESVGVMDSLGRPWFDIDLYSGRYYVNEYAPGDVNPTADPVATLIDTDRDGLADQKKNWTDPGNVQCAQSPPTWGSCNGAILERERGH